MRRVNIIGASGSGKTTLARWLSRELGVPHVELDALHNGPGWTSPSAEDFRAMVAPIVAQPSWIIDGGYGRKLGELVTRAADTIVWLDLPLVIALGRVLGRTTRRLILRTELWNGNRETLREAFGGRDSLVGWTIQRHAGLRRELPPLFATPAYADKAITRLRSARGVARFRREVLAMR